jgi:leucyl-tRNA synthetase
MAGSLLSYVFQGGSAPDGIHKTNHSKKRIDRATFIRQIFGELMITSHTEYEPFWQSKWDAQGIFKANETSGKPKRYVLDMFPYPSASGLHVGHVVGYAASDIYARYSRMKGYAVLHPMGWDAFGLPAEQHAIDTGEHPAKLTYRNIDNYRATLKKLGLSYDWNRELYTCDPSYYKWTQWIFKRLFEKGLAYQAEMLVNWCPALKTVLANEEVIDGKSERGGHPVQRVPMRQWMLRITAYAERLLNDLDKLDWPESVKDIQRNWIGRSEGANVTFQIVGYPDDSIEIFTTRADTLFGATYMVLAPEHGLVSQITSQAQAKAVAAYQEEASRKSDLERTDLAKGKTGVFTGAYAINPVNGEKIPVWISDYVLATYGTGAIMAVPGHDERDHEFARTFGLPIIKVVDCGPDWTRPIEDQAAPSKEGTLIQSAFLNGLSVQEAQKAIIAWLESKGLGRSQINYKIRDWLFSRQRYWGEPIPILKDGNGSVLRPLADNELPLTLPEVESYEPTGDGQSPLAAIRHWVERIAPDGTIEFIETDTMPGSAGSSWYFLRYCDPHNSTEPFAADKAQYWMPVDLYIGGQEHAVGHLLYSRFWTKVLFDAGVCPVDEPFKKLVNQGMMLRFGAKMSKSKGNGVNPDEVITQYGADALRVYEMFMGPLTQSKEWDDSNLAGVYRFLARVTRLYVNEDGTSQLNQYPAQLADKKALHKTIKKIGADIENLSLNTSIAQMMIFVNHVYETKCRSEEVLLPFLALLSPFAPHLAEELWRLCSPAAKGKSPDAADYPFVSAADWPEFDEQLTVDDEVTIGVQVNGKHRGEICVLKNATEAQAVDAARAVEGIASALEGKAIHKTIYVAGRILNFVVKQQ